MEIQLKQCFPATLSVWSVNATHTALQQLGVAALFLDSDFCDNNFYEIMILNAVRSLGEHKNQSQRAY